MVKYNFIITPNISTQAGFFQDYSAGIFYILHCVTVKKQFSWSLHYTLYIFVERHASVDWLLLRLPRMLAQDQQPVVQRFFVSLVYVCLITRYLCDLIVSNWPYRSLRAWQLMTVSFLLELLAKVLRLLGVRDQYVKAWGVLPCIAIYKTDNDLYLRPYNA